VSLDLPKKKLVLHVEIPGLWADDLPARAAEMSDPPGPAEYLFVVVEELMRSDVGLTLVTLPGEKEMAESFEVHSYVGRIVGAEVHDA
jgi:hypothetical protein